MDIEKNLLDKSDSVARLISMLKKNKCGKKFFQGLVCSFLLEYENNCIKNRLALDK